MPTPAKSSHLKICFYNVFNPPFPGRGGGRRGPAALRFWSVQHIPESDFLWLSKHSNFWTSWLSQLPTSCSGSRIISFFVNAVVPISMQDYFFYVHVHAVFTYTTIFLHIHVGSMIWAISTRLCNSLFIFWLFDYPLSQLGLHKVELSGLKILHIFSKEFL